MHFASQEMTITVKRCSPCTVEHAADVVAFIKERIFTRSISTYYGDTSEGPAAEYFNTGEGL